MMRKIVVQVWECYFVFCSDWLSNDNLIDIIEFIPVFIPNGGKPNSNDQNGNILSLYQIETGCRARHLIPKICNIFLTLFKNSTVKTLIVSNKHAIQNPHFKLFLF